MLKAVFSGCTDSALSEPSVTTPANRVTITKTFASIAVTKAQPPVTTVKVTPTENTVRIFKGDYHRVEYRENNTITLPPNPRFQGEYEIKLERSTGDYLGTPAIHYTITATTDNPEWVGDILVHAENGWMSVTDRYFRISNDKSLGGTTTETIKGIVKPPTTLPADEKFSPENQPSGKMGIMPFGEMNISLSDEGAESVTVPAGTYPDARKNTGTFGDSTPNWILDCFG